TTQDANGKSRTDAVLLIPLNQDYVNQKLNITYQTQVAKDMTDPGNMDQGVNLMMKNEAKSVWRWPSGTGTGSWDEHGGITIDKDLAGSYHVLSKNAWNSNHQSTYDEATNTLTWNFKINQVGADLTDAVLTDIFDSKKQLLLLKDGTPDLQLKDFDGNDGPLIKEHSKAGNDPRYYEITTSGDSDTFTLHLGAIGAKEHYTFSLAVRVLDVTMNSEEAKATVHNEAKLDYKVGDKTGSSTVSADADVVNTILKKTRVPVVEGSQVYYDYANHTVKWKTTVNPKHFAMGVPTLTDLLPEGTCLEDISVTRVRGNQPGETKDFAGSGAGDARIWNPVSFGDGETISVLQQKATPDLATPMFTQREAVFAFTNIAGDNTNASYEFTYTTSLDEDYRKKYLTGNQGVTLMNEVKLSNETTTIVASDKAPNKIAPAGMTKNGQYVSYKEPNSYSYPYMDGDTKKTKEMDVDVIHWTIFVNRTHADLTGVSIEDTVADFLELVPASLKVESIPTLTASGEIPEATPGAPSDITDVTDQFLAQSGSRMDETGFSLKIPAAWKSTTLRITCDTVLVDSANATTMKNAVSLKGQDLDSSITSNIPKGAKDFRIANYAHAKGVYYAGIQKVSSNESGVGKFPLKGAKFQLEKMVLKANGTSTDKADWEAAASPKAKIKTGNRKGNANFLFLEADTLYRLTETVPPAGYEKLNTEWYLVPKLTSKTADYFPTPASGTTEWEMILPETGGQHITKVIENKTSGTGGEVSFTKKNGTGSGAKGLAGAKFSIEHIQGQLKFDPVSSDAEGKITITGLDQTSKLGKYKVKEIEAPVGYRLDSKEFFVTVAYDAQKGYTTEVTGLGGTAPDYVVVNEPLVPELVFSKVDQNGDAIGSDRMKVSFAVTGNTQANLEGADLDGTAVTVPGTVSTDQEGKVKIRLPYGSYTLTETLSEQTDIDKLQDPSKLAKLYVKVEQIAKSAPEAPASGQTKVSISTDANFAEGSTRTITKADTAVKTVPFDFSDAKTAAAYLAVTNDLNYGCVQVHKVLGERDNNGALQAVTKDQNTIPIQGAKFDIYHKNTDQSKGTLVMTLTTDTAGKFPIQKN
ncbi:MAG: SpaA isopeptide-forming pilin-related protein, partial [Hungatella sp.]